MNSHPSVMAIKIAYTFPVLLSIKISSFLKFFFVYNNGDGHRLFGPVRVSVFHQFQFSIIFAYVHFKIIACDVGQQKQKDSFLGSLQKSDALSACSLFSFGKMEKICKQRWVIVNYIAMGSSFVLSKRKNRQGIIFTPNSFALFYLKLFS